MAKNAQASEYIDGLVDDARKLAIKLRAMIFAAAPKATEVFKWSRPCYELDSPFCYIVANKKHINIGFNEGASLDDPQGLLEGTGKSMRHVKIDLASGTIPPGVKVLIENAAQV